MTSSLHNKHYNESNKQLEQLNHIVEMKHLNTLDLSCNQLNTIQLISLTYLIELNISNNKLTSLQPNDLPTSLRSLNVSHNQLISFDETIKLPSLTHLNVSHNRLTSLNHLAICCPLLCEIDASSNQLCDVNEIQSLNKCQMLFKLVVIDNPLVQQPVDDTSIGWLERVMYLVPQLEIIQFEHNDETQQSIPVEAYLSSCAEHGDDEQRRIKLTRYYRCRGDRTRAHHVNNKARVEWAGLVGVQRVLEDESDVDLTLNGVSTDLIRDVRPFLPEPRFWTFMAEHGLTNQWIDLERTIHRNARMATQHSQRIRLDLDGLQLGCAGLRCVAQALLNRATRDAVNELSFDGAVQHNRFISHISNHFGLMHLLQAITLSNVSTLEMKNCSFGITECDIISEHLALNASSRLQHLDLSWNHIGVHQYLEGIQIRQCPGLGALVSSPAIKQLLTLNLSNNGIDHIGARQITLWLLECQVQTLILDGNPLDDSSIEMLSQSLSRNSTVQTLSLSGLPLTSPSGGLSINALTSLTSCLATSNDTIQSVNLSNNRMLCTRSASSVSAGSLIAQWLKRDLRFRSSLCILQSIDLTNTGLLVTDLPPIAAVLNDNSTLQHLKLSVVDSKSITVEQSRGFLEAVFASSLVSLEACGVRCDVSNADLMYSLNLVCSRHPSLMSLVLGPIVGSGPANRWENLPPRSTILSHIELLGESQHCVQSIDRLLLEVLQIPSLHNLTLRGVNMPYETVRVLTSMFAGFSRVTSVNFIDCCFPVSNELEPMFDSMLANPSLRHFSLERTRLISCHWQGLLNVMQSRKSRWTSIRLSECGLSFIDACSARYLLSQPALTELDLSDNSFDANSLHELIDLIPICQQLRRCILTTGRVPFHLDNRTFFELRHEWSAVISSLIAHGCDLKEIGLPHINVRSRDENDQLVDDVISALTKAAARSSARGSDAVPMLRSLILPRSLSFGRSARSRLVKVLDAFPTLSVGTDGAKVFRLTCIGDMSIFEEDRTLNAVSAKLAVTRLTK